MNIQCIRACKSKGLTDNKNYNVIKETLNDYLIINDLGLKTFYKKNRFRTILN